MQYLCEKQLTAGGKIFYPGNIIPDGVILPERSSKLKRNGYITELDGTAAQKPAGNQTGMFTQEQVDSMISEAVAEMQQKHEELQQAVAELKETEPGAFEETVQISLKGESDGENEQITVIPATPDEIQQVFSIMQMNTDEGPKAIAEVQSENVLIVLHAADSRKTIKEAAKKQADNLFSTNGKINESTGGNATTDTNKEGADT